MTLKTRQRPLSETIAYKDDSTKFADVDQDNALRRIAMLFKIVLETPASSTAGTTGIQDDILNAIEKVLLEMSSDENKFSVDGRKAAFVQEIETGTPIKKDTLSIPSAGNKSTHHVLIDLDFAVARQNLSDIRALLDASNLSSLRLKVDWGSISDVLATPNDTIINADDSEVSISLVEVFDDEVDDPRLFQEEIIKQGLIPKTGFLDIREGIETFDVTKAHTSFETSVLQKDIDPTPTNIWTTLLLALEDRGSVTGTPVRANDIITDLRVENVKGNGEKIFQQDFEFAHFSNKTEYGLENLTTGLFYMDWRDQRRGGLVNIVSDALKWKFLTNAPKSSETDEIQVYTRYVPV